MIFCDDNISIFVTDLYQIHKIHACSMWRKRQTSDKSFITIFSWNTFVILITMAQHLCEFIITEGFRHRHFEFTFPICLIKMSLDSVKGTQKCATRYVNEVNIKYNGWRYTMFRKTLNLHMMHKKNLKKERAKLSVVFCEFQLRRKTLYGFKTRFL